MKPEDEKAEIKPTHIRKRKGGMRGGDRTVEMTNGFMRLVEDEVNKLPPRARLAIKGDLDSTIHRLKGMRRKGIIRTSQQSKKLMEVAEFAGRTIVNIVKGQPRLTKERSFRYNARDEYIQGLLSNILYPFIEQLDPTIRLEYRYHTSEGPYFDLPFQVRLYRGETPAEEAPAEEAPAEEEEEEEEEEPMPPPPPPVNKPPVKKSIAKK
jgi:hypothetical protein